LWIFRPLLAKYLTGLSDAGIAIVGAVILFFIPVNFKNNEFLVDWPTARKLPWGVLLLFGGGLSLASAISSTGLSSWIGNQLTAVSTWPIVLVVLIIALIIIFLTELTSNTATAAAFLPIMASVAVSIGHNPLLLVIPSAVAASCAFMLPVATPPNAIIYGSGMITIPQMTKAGFWLNVIFILLVTLLTFTIVRLVFGLEIGVLPDWAIS
jgi:solute carrier family 13 (sodium-dependent dicarboxylate transporter), member 2/3/5